MAHGFEDVLEEFDDDVDPLAPVFYADEEPDEDEEPEDGGFSDDEKIVRLWVTDGRLTKVRVTPVWYVKLKGRSLGIAFSQALGRANWKDAQVVSLPAGVDPEDPSTFHLVPATREEPFADVDFSWVPRVSGGTSKLLQKLRTESLARVQAAQAAVRPSRPRRTEGRAKGVVVRLNELGEADAVVFDEKWLDDAQAGTICNHVMAAASDAYRRFVPVEQQPTPVDEAMEEYKFLNAVLRAQLRGSAGRAAAASAAQVEEA